MRSEKHFVELVLAEYGAQGRLGQHVRGRQIVLDLDDRAFGIDDVEIEHRVDFHRNIVAGDDVLAGDFNDLNAQVYPHHLLNEGRQQNKAGALHPLKAAQGEDDGALVFAQDAHGGHQADGDRKKDEEDEKGFNGKHDPRTFIWLVSVPVRPDGQSTPGVVTIEAAQVSARKPKLATMFDPEAASDSTHEMIALWEDKCDVRLRDSQ